MVKNRKTLMGLRLVCILVTILALALVFRSLNLPALRRVMQGMHPGWFLAALAVYGLLFVPAALRWHIILRLSGCAGKFRTTLSFTVLGHFMYTIFFGAIGGDGAKAYLYSEWRKHNLSKVLASAPLDRLLGFGGLVLLAVCSLSIAAFYGDHTFSNLPLFRRNPWAVFAVVVLVLIALLVLRKSSPESALGRFAVAFGSSARALRKNPTQAFLGIGCGFLVHLGLCSTLAFNLRAVTDGSLPWAKLAWTFPVVVILGGLPITAAGLGAREGAALVLLTVYAVTSEQAVAASLLTATAAIVWAFIGGAVFWYERTAAKSRVDADLMAKNAASTRGTVFGAEA
jgi:uncharacterized membrane protein YbhN (UPF0104 family)